MLVGMFLVPDLLTHWRQMRFSPFWVPIAVLAAAIFGWMSAKSQVALLSWLVVAGVLGLSAAGWLALVSAVRLRRLQRKHAAYLAEGLADVVRLGRIEAQHLTGVSFAVSGAILLLAGVLGWLYAGLPLSAPIAAVGVLAAGLILGGAFVRTDAPRAALMALIPPKGSWPDTHSEALTMLTPRGQAAHAGRVAFASGDATRGARELAAISDHPGGFWPQITHLPGHSWRLRQRAVWVCVLALWRLLVLAALLAWLLAALSPFQALPPLPQPWSLFGRQAPEETPPPAETEETAPADGDPDADDSPGDPDGGEGSGGPSGSGEDPGAESGGDDAGEGPGTGDTGSSDAGSDAESEGDGAGSDPGNDVPSEGGGEQGADAGDGAGGEDQNPTGDQARDGTDPNDAGAGTGGTDQPSDAGNDQTADAGTGGDRGDPDTNDGDAASDMGSGEATPDEAGADAPSTSGQPEPEQDGRGAPDPDTGQGTGGGDAPDGADSATQTTGQGMQDPAPDGSAGARTDPGPADGAPSDGAPTEDTGEASGAEQNAESTFDPASGSGPAEPTGVSQPADPAAASSGANNDAADSEETAPTQAMGTDDPTGEPGLRPAGVPADGAEGGDDPRDVQLRASGWGGESDEAAPTSPDAQGYAGVGGLADSILATPAPQTDLPTDPMRTQQTPEQAVPPWVRTLLGP